MQKRKLGNTGLEVSEIAFGGVEIGMPYGIGIRGKEDMLSEQDAVHLLHEAMDKGINFFDTARMYGQSEQLMGKAFEGMREQVIISTKCAHLPTEEEALSDSNQVQKKVGDSLEESLKTLKTDYLDIFMLHNANKAILSDDELTHFFLELKKSGKVRSIGASVYLPEETEYAIESGIWDVIQLPFNLLDQRQKTSFEQAARQGVGLVVRSALSKGLLTERGRQLHPELNSVKEHIKKYHQLLDQNIPDLPTLATKFALSFDEVSAVLVGIDRSDYLQSAIKVGDGEYLNKDELRKAEALSYPDPAFLNLPYWDKMGWLK